MAAHDGGNEVIKDAFVRFIDRVWYVRGLEVGAAFDKLDQDKDGRRTQRQFAEAAQQYLFSTQYNGAGAGAKGPRRYDWAAVDLIPTHSAGTCQLLIRRDRTTGQVVHYRCFRPRPVALPALVRVAGTPWLRWATLAMLAHAFLAVIRAGEHQEHPTPTGLIALTCNETHRLFALPAASPNDQRDHRLRWSLWRRRHQARARDCHYRRREATA
ncbi:hypothetical protein GCM10027168_11310 [Streptomyces capparidis]